MRRLTRWASATTLPESLRKALAGLATQLATIRDHEAEVTRLEQRQTEIGQEQARLRENLGAVPKDSEAARYLIAAGEDPAPSFADGLQVQLVLDAVERSAAANAIWTEIPS